MAARPAGVSLYMLGSKGSAAEKSKHKNKQTNAALRQPRRELPSQWPMMDICWDHELCGAQPSTFPGRRFQTGSGAGYMLHTTLEFEPI
jgi:hypothetical protein